MHPALLLETLDRLADLTIGKFLDRLLQGWVFLPDDLIEMGRVEACFLELLERAAGFDTLMLAAITHEEDTVSLFQSMQKLLHLSAARQTRLIDNVETFLTALASTGSSCQMMLKRARSDTGILKLLGSARCRRQAFYLVAFPFGGFPDCSERSGLAGSSGSLQAHQLISAAREVFDSLALFARQVSELGG